MEWSTSGDRKWQALATREEVLLLVRRNRKFKQEAKLLWLLLWMFVVWSLLAIITRLRMGGKMAKRNAKQN